MSDQEGVASRDPPHQNGLEEGRHSCSPSSACCCPGHLLLGASVSTSLVGLLLAPLHPNSAHGVEGSLGCKKAMKGIVERVQAHIASWGVAHCSPPTKVGAVSLAVMKRQLWGGGVSRQLLGWVLRSPPKTPPLGSERLRSTWKQHLWVAHFIRGMGLLSYFCANGSSSVQTVRQTDASWVWAQSCLCTP